MTFAVLEESRYDGKPFELCRFAREGEIFTYTSADHPITHNTEVYEPAPSLKVDPVSIKTTTGADSLTLNVPMDHPIAEKFRVYVPATGMSVTIFMGHVGDTDVIYSWQGIILGIVWNDNGEATIQCESIRSIIRRGGLPYRFGPLCQHAVYRGGCGLSISANSIDIVVSAVNGKSIQSLDLIGLTNGDYLAGLATFQNYDTRTITYDQGDTIEVNRPYENLQAGDTMTISLGCNKTVARCQELANFVHYFAFNTIPTVNLFDSGLD